VTLKTAEQEITSEKSLPTDIRDVLMRPGTRLIMPSEESEIYRGEERAAKQYDVFRGSRNSPSNPHEFGGRAFAKVFANELANSQIEKTNPIFPVGSMIAREKLASETAQTPEFVAVMVKREKGFSKKTGDWEYFTFKGEDLSLLARETKSDCSKCHASAKETDFVFRTYLKK
jgi:Cytochrome P460